MTECQIFRAASAMRTIGEELEALLEEFSIQLEGYGQDRLTLESWDYTDGENVWSTVWQGARFNVKLRGARRPRPLMVRLELTRDAIPKSDWPHAKDALIVVAYDPILNNEWSVDQMAIRADGRLVDADAWLACKDTIYLDRLLEWGGVSGGDLRWSQRSWLFAVPIRLLSSPEAMTANLTSIVCGLLLDVDLESIDLDMLVRWPLSD